MCRKLIRQDVHALVAGSVDFFSERPTHKGYCWVLQLCCPVDEAFILIIPNTLFLTSPLL